MQFVYNLVTLPVSLLLGFLFLLHPRGKKRLRERFGLWEPIPDPVLWLHGASVGEVNGLLQLVPGLRKEYPDRKILLTATSVTGLERGQNMVDYQQLVPFDCALWIFFAIRRVSVQKFIFGETEIWPALLHALQRRGVACFMANATISDFTFRKYRMVQVLLKPVLSKLTGVAAATLQSKQRLEALGAPEKRVALTGNSKYDAVPSILDVQDSSALRKKFFDTELPVVVLGSIRPGEEVFWLPAILASADRLRWIFVPRHQEKFDFFANALHEAGVPFTRWSELVGTNEVCKTSVLLLDAMGMLEQVYSFANLAFIGATLIPGIGGHNPLEAAAYETPVVLGPHVKNVSVIVEEMQSSGGCFCVETKADIQNLIQGLCTGTAAFAEVGKAGATVAKANRGATKRILALILQQKIVDSTYTAD